LKLPMEEQHGPRYSMIKQRYRLEILPLLVQIITLFMLEQVKRMAAAVHSRMMRMESTNRPMAEQPGRVLDEITRTWQVALPCILLIRILYSRPRWEICMRTLPIGACTRQPTVVPPGTRCYM